MSKTRKRSLALLVVLAMLATLFMLPGTASAAATYSAGSLAKVQAGNQNLGKLLVEVPASELSVGDYFTLRLPTDFDYNVAVGTGYTLTQVAGTDDFKVNNDPDLKIRIPKIDNAFYNSTTSSYGSAGITVDVVAKNEIKIYVVPTAVVNTDKKTGYFYVLFENTKVDSSSPATIEVVIEGRDGSPFSPAKVPLAQYGTGIVTLSVDSVKTITTSVEAIDKIRIKEDRPGAFANGKDIKLKLPSGFKWDTSSAVVKINDAESTAAGATLAKQDDDRTLKITSTYTSSTRASYFMIDGLGVEVSDESIAKMGNVEATVSGDASAIPGSIVVAKYGDYSVSVSAFGDPKEVIAGRIEQEIGKFVIEEGIAGSLSASKSITITLTGGAKWDATYLPQLDNVNSNNTGEAIISGKSWSIVGTNDDQIRLTLGGTPSGNAVKAVYEKAKIKVSPNASGDIKLVFSGSAGVTGEVVVAKVVKPVTASIEGSPAKVVLGAQGQEIPAIIVAENKAEAIDATTAGKKNLLRLEFPMDVLPSMPSKVEVIEGDLVIDPSYTNRAVTNDGRWYIEMKIKSTSSKPSKIKVSGVKLNVSRTVPEGALNVAVKGPAVVQTTDDFPGYTSAAVVKVADLITPAPGEQKATASFVIGSTTYKVNGVEKTMDVAPYIKDGRTFMPLRYVGMSLGVAEQNIIWDDAAKTATLMKGDKVVQVKIGSTALIVNGVTINMDVAPEIKDGRTMMPLRFIAQAFGAKLTWDDATKTASFEL